MKSREIDMLALFKKKYIIRRYANQTFVDGYERSAYEDSSALLNVQPLTSDELQALPEGERAVKRFKAFGTVALRTADEAAGTKADLVYIDGAWYEVKSSNPWRHISLLAHGYVELVLVDKQPPPPKMEVSP